MSSSKLVKWIIQFINEMFVMAKNKLTHADETLDEELTICMSQVSYDIASNMKNINKSFIAQA